MIKVNSHTINVTRFPDKTSQVWNLPEPLLRDPIIVIQWAFEAEEELIHVAQVVDLFRKYDDELSESRTIELYMPYMPYARQDKGVSNSTTFAGRTFSKFLMMLDVNLVTSVDVHNPELFQGLGNFLNLSPQDQIIHVIEKEQADVVVFPDEGAKRRYSDQIAHAYDLPVIFGTKVRDQATGEIVGFDFVGDRPEVNSDKSLTYLVCDDIIDGGATPIRVARELNLRPQDRLIGFFSHCLCTKGTEIIKEAGYSKLYNYQGFYN